MSPLLSTRYNPPEGVESALVAACRRPELDSQTAPSIETVARHGRLSDLVAMAGDHGVLGLTLSRVLPRLDGPNAPETRELKRGLHDLRLRSSMLELKCRHVVSTLESRQISPVVLKGAAISLMHFPEPWQRDLADLDLMVRPEDVMPAIETLESRGYRNPSSSERTAQLEKHHFHLPLVHKDGHYVEIHWALTRPDSWFRLDPDRVYWSSTRVETDLGAVMRVPRAEHMLLHIVIQNLQEGFSRIGRTVDVDRIVSSTPDLDWEFLAAEAARGELCYATALSLQLAARLLDTTVPSAAKRSMFPPTIPRFHLALLRPERHLLSQQATRIGASEALLSAWLSERAGRLGRTVRETFQQHGLRLGAVRLAKVASLQLFLYLGVPFGRGGSRDRAFWGTPAPLR